MSKGNSWVPEILHGNSEAIRIIRSINWAETSLGVFNMWPQELITTLGIIINSKIPMFLFWGKDHLLFYNDAYIPAFGTEESSPMGKKAKDVWKGNWEFIRPQIDQVNYGNDVVVSPNDAAKISNLKPNPDIDLTYHLSPVKNIEGNSEGVLVICNETISISAREQLQAQKELASLNQEITQLFNTINEGFYSRDVVNGKYIKLSAGCPKIYGYTIEEFFANPMLWAEVIHPDDKERVFNDDITLKEGKQTLTEYRIFHKDNSLRWIEIKAIPVLTNGLLTRVDGIVTDITERKKAEEERDKITADLIEKNINLKQFSYIVSHNLRSPINRILGLTSLFKVDPEKIDPNQRLVRYIENEARNLDNVVKDLTTIVSYQDLGVYAKESIIFEEELKLSLHSLENEVIKSKALITSDFRNPDRMQNVRGYFYSILYNLLSNAIKYRNPERPLKIHLQTSQDDNFIYFTITDNGLGIDLEKNRDKIFGLYNRFHTNYASGKGIGLNLVKTQAETLGGKVEIDSTPDKGSTFKVSFKKD